MLEQFGMLARGERECYFCPWVQPCRTSRVNHSSTRLKWVERLSRPGRHGFAGVRWRLHRCQILPSNLSSARACIGILSARTTGGHRYTISILTVGIAWIYADIHVDLATVVAIG